MKLSKKVVLLGHFGVGKTSLFRRFIDDEFSEEYKVTIGVQIKKKVITLDNGDEISLILWDTEGHMDLEDTRRSYLLGAHAFVYVFDVTRAVTYQDTAENLEILKEEFPKVLLTCIGNKLDLVIDKKKLETKFPFKVDAFTSAKEDTNVTDFFKKLGIQLNNINSP
ncbi:GTP-binding protein [Aquimarina sp. ERC-38]|uniref:Rab family GTPase n=1 Tax=Aquimarina sp. ERC-38 TaxID=2949996 RepID=UPI00224618A0|nr:Rab family GTPase [Aquimarina sp. ERC-38]UZO81955.1 GTP-binding protein [Aquimarina sp. ERC-38]